MSYMDVRHGPCICTMQTQITLNMLFDGVSNAAAHGLSCFRTSWVALREEGIQRLGLVRELQLNTDELAS